MGEIKTTNENAKVAVVVGFYFIVSIALVIANKVVLSSPTIGLPAPMFVVWYQLLVTLICLVVLGSLGKTYTTLSFIPAFEFQLEKASKLLYLSGIFLGMIIFNNLCLLYVEVSFYQVARALTILLNIVLTYYILHIPTSWQASQACIVVVVGFILGCLGEDNLNSGVVFGIISSVFVALYSIYVKKALPVVDGNHWKLMHYTTVISLLLLLPIMLIAGEEAIIRDSKAIYDVTFWIAMTGTGLLGFLINIAIYLQIKHTSPVMHNISGTAKAGIQTLVAVVVFQNQISFVNGLGILLVVAGSYWYSHIRFVETQQEAKLKEEKETNV